MSNISTNEASQAVSQRQLSMDTNIETSRRPIIPTQTGVNPRDYTSCADPRECRPSIITGQEWEEEPGWFQKAIDKKTEMEMETVTHTVSSEERGKLPMLTQAELQERIKTCTKVAGDYMGKTKEGELEVIFIANFHALVQNEENAEKLSQIPESALAEIVKRGWKPNPPKPDDVRHSKYWKLDKVRCEAQQLLWGLWHWGCRR